LRLYTTYSTKQYLVQATIPYSKQKNIEMIISGTEKISNTPMDITDYIASKRFIFSPDKEPPDGGERFQTFLALQANPDALVENRLKNNPGFLNAISMLRR